MSVDPGGMPLWAVELNRRFEAARTREAKLEVLRQYMSDDMALDALSVMTKNSEVGIIDVSKRRPVDVT